MRGSLSASVCGSLREPIRKCGFAPAHRVWNERAPRDHYPMKRRGVSPDRFKPSLTGH